MNAVREMRAVYRRVPTRMPLAGRELTPPGAVARLACELIGADASEKLIVLHLDAKNRLLSFSIAGVGSVAQCPVSLAEVFKTALLANAAGVIVAHNHPSGDPAPSQEDHALTLRLVEAGKLLAVPVVDHVVVTPDVGVYFSYAAERRLGGAARAIAAAGVHEESEPRDASARCRDGGFGSSDVDVASERRESHGA